MIRTITALHAVLLQEGTNGKWGDPPARGAIIRKLVTFHIIMEQTASGRMDTHSQRHRRCVPDVTDALKRGGRTSVCSTYALHRSFRIIHNSYDFGMERRKCFKVWWFIRVCTINNYNNENRNNNNNDVAFIFRRGHTNFRLFYIIYLPFVPIEYSTGLTSFLWHCSNI